MDAESWAIVSGILLDVVLKQVTSRIFQGRVASTLSKASAACQRCGLDGLDVSSLVAHQRTCLAKKAKSPSGGSQQRESGSQEERVFDGKVYRKLPSGKNDTEILRT